ncbi:peroxidase family protein [Aliiglaciecola sp. 3_MG-2023]|uniref:peroxidase family protein n=1 Tax=Aliiglaciecola sp. 3_MG-2023 TaxID=3062644 RepID=UPI0026E4519A|nr:peroxidase family protein [Aliiglaciecola sp. 3_MG-2023]MDO6693845.1 peroxidase family protein [Aliiglaciecola sp. 3_MG-2023]
MNKRYLIIPLSIGQLTMISACGSGESETASNSDAVTLATAEISQDNQTNQQRGGSNTRSSQGIDEDVEVRRNNELNRPGRDEMQMNEQDGREIRSYDGTSNNQQHPTWGATFTHLQRIAEANYTDGISSMAGSTQKSAREISNLLVSQAQGQSIENSFDTSDYLWQWGQFIDHDIGLTDGSTPEQENIPVPRGDVFFDPNGSGEVVIPFNRAIYDPDTGTSIENVREQENEITSWIDGSMIYGSDNERNSALRVGDNSPFLATSSNNLLPFNTDNIPNANGFVTDPSRLFIGGDLRVNEQAVLTAMHTVWLREHNRIARILQSSQTNASIESIYEQARRLVIAEIQIITYNEYLPALLGENSMPDYQGYDETINPTIYNEFSAATYRLGHSEVSDSILRLDADGNTIEEGNLAIRDAFFTGINLYQNENDIDPVLRGLAKQRHQTIDTQVVNGLRNFLFGTPGSGGFDLISLNIQRGRDHGLNTYNQTRIAMDLEAKVSIADITTNTSLQAGLFNAYGSVDDIELWIGGLAEDPLTSQGSQLGELFTAINVKQFDELRAGDRFWYSRYLTDDELEFVEDVTLAEVIRNNTNIGDELQDNVFYVE